MPDCDICCKNFQKKRYLQAHYKRCSKKVKSASAGDGPVKLPPLACSMCGKEFARLSHLQRHQLAHLNARDHTCKDCERSFAQKEHLERHVKAVHGPKAGIAVFPCEKCPGGKSFPSRWELNRHQRRVHALEALCRQCGHTSETEKQRRRHMEWHRGRRRYSCATCVKAFKHKSELDNHQATHQPDVAGFQCLACRQIFVQRTQLNRHIFAQHCAASPRSLCSCGRRLASRNDLLLHLQTQHHLSITSVFPCKFCHEWFRHHQDYLQHSQSTHFIKISRPSDAPETLRCAVLLIEIGEKTGVGLERLELGSQLPPLLTRTFPYLRRLEIIPEVPCKPGESLVLELQLPKVPPTLQDLLSLPLQIFLP